jgi:hypothetical protein
MFCRVMLLSIVAILGLTSTAPAGAAKTHITIVRKVFLEGGVAPSNPNLPQRYERAGSGVFTLLAPICAHLARVVRFSLKALFLGVARPLATAENEPRLSRILARMHGRHQICL